MGDDSGHERQEVADNAGLSGGHEGWVSTDVAAKALGVSPRTVRRMLDRGELQGRLEADGINKAWTVDITSVQRLRDERNAAGRGREESRTVSGVADYAADVVRDLAADLAEARYRLGRAESRIELTAQTESTLREALERERERADRLEAELREHRGVRPESTRDEPHGTETPADDTGEPRRSSWWRRFFGFEQH